jgi:hypothetical protein
MSHSILDYIFLLREKGSIFCYLMVNWQTSFCRTVVFILQW